MAEPILTETDFAELTANLKRLDEAEENIRQAVQAGLDMGAEQIRVRDLKAQLLKLKQAYFPNR